MVNKALVLCTTGNKDVQKGIIPKTWEEYELRKANWFIDGLMMWGWTRNNITFIAPINIDVNTHNPDIHDKNEFKGEFVRILEQWDSDPYSDFVAVYISDNMPCSGEIIPPDGEKYDEGLIFDKTKNANDSANIEAINLSSLISQIDKGDGQEKLCVIVSGKGVECTGASLHSNKYLTMISHDAAFDSTIFTAQDPGDAKDLFNIGGQMPMVQPNDFQQAFIMERNRCINLGVDSQYPVIFLE